MTATGDGWLAALRHGDWLDGERTRVYGRMLLLFYAVITVAWLALSHAGLDLTGNPLGPDFLNVYAAGRMVNEGRPAAVYDWPQHAAVETEVLPHAGYYGWHYPPPFLALAAPLARLPYLGALAVYSALTLVLYGLSVLVLLDERGWRLRGDALVLTLAFPAAFINFGHGQNGFLTAALLTGGLGLLDRRPWLAGVLIGLLAYKPQFGLLIPVALLAAGAWAAIAAAAVTVLATAALSAWVFGLDAWFAFVQSWQLTRTVILEQGATGWEKIVSLFSAARGLGAPLAVAYGVQALGAVLAALAVALLWYRSADHRLRIASLALALPLGTPYVLDYDLTVLLPAIAALALAGLEGGFRPWRKLLLALVFFMPLVSRQIGLLTHLPVMQAAVLALFVSVVREGLAYRRTL